jgi:hypothetical protein
VSVLRWEDFTDISEKHAASIFRSEEWPSSVLMMKAAFQSEISMNVYQTVWCHIPEDSYVQRCFYFWDFFIFTWNVFIASNIKHNIKMIANDIYIYIQRGPKVTWVSCRVRAASRRQQQQWLKGCPLSNARLYWSGTGSTASCETDRYSASKNFSTFHGAKKLVTVFTRACY